MKKVLVLVALIGLFITVHGFPPSCSEIIGSAHADGTIHPEAVAAVVQETAQPATQQTGIVGPALKDLLNNTVIPLVISLVGALVSLALLKLKNKFNIELKAVTEEWIQKQAERAVQMVAEKAAASEKVSGLKVGSNDKLNTAIAWLITKVPALTQDQADAYIHAAIARIPGVGATGEQSLTPVS